MIKLRKFGIEVWMGFFKTQLWIWSIFRFKKSSISPQLFNWVFASDKTYVSYNYRKVEFRENSIFIRLTHVGRKENYYREIKRKSDINSYENSDNQFFLLIAHRISKEKNVTKNKILHPRIPKIPPSQKKNHL